MSEQAVDLRSTWAVLRRHGAALAAAALVGAAAGLGLLVLDPPAFTSTSVVLLPAAAQSDSGRTGGYDAETQVLIATSSEVLTRAGRSSDPELTSDEVGDRLVVEVPAPSVLQIRAAGATASEAEDLAYAVSESLLAYLQETNTTLSQGRRVQLQERLETLSASLSTVNQEITKATKRITANGQSSTAGAAHAAALSDLTAVRASTVLEIEVLQKQLAGEDQISGGVGGGATVIQPASEGRRSDLITDGIIHVAGGAAALVLLASIYVIATNARDPKLRSRDEIAAAVGIPVLASLRARPPRSASGWSDLLKGYEPDNVDGWALRQLIHGLTRADGSDRSAAGDRFVLVVLSLSGDEGGLAIGPQIARYIASHGITCALVAAHPHPAASTLWAACSRPSRHGDGRGALSVSTATADPTAAGDPAAPDASVRIVVLDRESPEAPATSPEGARTILALSSASVTRTNLADAVVAADRRGLVVHGIVVANPDPFDRTSGRLAPLDMPETALPDAIPITGRPGAKASGDRGGSRRQDRRGQR